nr:putative zinc finger, CCHC-type, retrotransposon Gag domain protein [Tanacetum cinerariifolium]
MKLSGSRLEGPQREEKGCFKGTLYRVPAVAALLGKRSSFCFKSERNDVLCGRANYDEDHVNQVKKVQRGRKKIPDISDKPITKPTVDIVRSKHKKEILEVKDDLKKVLEREPTDGKLAETTDMNVSQLRKQIRLGQAARNKLIKGDQTPSPRDESSDSDSDSEPEAEEADDEPEAEDADDELEVEEAGVKPEAEGANVELEAEEPDGVPEAVIRAGSQRPFAICGLAPWAFRHDLEALCRHERIREAESETGRTEVALLGSEAKIGKMEREILHHDLSSVEETLGKVVERLKVLESKENATLRKKLAENEVLLDLTRMERDRTERRLSESIRWNKGFYLEMVRKGAIPKPPSDDEGSERSRKTSKKSDGDEGPSDPRGSPNGAGGPRGASGSGGAGRSGGTGGNADGTGVRGTGPTVPELTGCTYATFIKCDPLPFIGTEGAVGLCQWLERLEFVFQISECKEKDRVKFAMATLRGRALTWW